MFLNHYTTANTFFTCPGTFSAFLPPNNHFTPRKRPKLGFLNRPIQILSILCLYIQQFTIFKYTFRRFSGILMNTFGRTLKDVLPAKGKIHGPALVRRCSSAGGPEEAIFRQLVFAVVLLEVSLQLSSPTLCSPGVQLSNRQESLQVNLCRVRVRMRN